MAEKKKGTKKPKRIQKQYQPGKEIRAILTGEQIAQRNELKLLIAHLTDRAYGRISDNEVIGKAIELYFQTMIGEGEVHLPVGYEEYLKTDRITKFQKSVEERKKYEALMKNQEE